MQWLFGQLASSLGSTRCRCLSRTAGGRRFYDRRDVLSPPPPRTASRDMRVPVVSRHPTQTQIHHALLAPLQSPIVCFRSFTAILTSVWF